MHNTLLSWPQYLDAAKSDLPLKARCDSLIEAARNCAAREVIRRVYRYEDVGRHRTYLDPRAKALSLPNKELFALAMSDQSATTSAGLELSLLSAAYRLSGEQLFLRRTIAQLDEMATWSPLQRPGWTCYREEAKLPPRGDGNWLSTGEGIRGIAQAIEILPDGVSEELRNKLRTLLGKEIASIVDDWRSKRPWFVIANNAITNQWVLPTEGLIRACLVLGAADHPEAYALGVKNLLQALDSHGERGEFEEGLHYAAYTVTSMLHAAHAMALAGDRRAIDHPFLVAFPTWVVHHLQPGRMGINCFDAFGASPLSRTDERMRSLLSLIAVMTGAPVARWALQSQFDGPSDDLPGLAARTLPAVASSSAPTPFAAYQRAARINWRSNWRDDATGIWIRGGDALDQHDHQDRGHISFVLHGTPVCIEAGTPAYHHPQMSLLFSSGMGHNVLQIGTEEPVVPSGGDFVKARGWQLIGAIAPFDVQHMDESGGEASVACSRCYEGLQQWRRNVRWNSDAMMVSDMVSLADEMREVIIFRWHLATRDAVQLSGAGRNFLVTWKNIHISIEASQDLLVSQVFLPDVTLEKRSWEDPRPDDLHTCLVLQSAEAVAGLRLVTSVRSLNEAKDRVQGTS